MKGWSAIYRRELAGLFLSPLAWILFCLTLIYNGLFFRYYLISTGGDVDAAMMYLMGNGLPFWMLCMFLPPLLTMRMISEESRSGMLEFLLTAPVADAAVVVGKAVAATTFLSLVWACSGIYALFMAGLGAAPDWGLVLTGWLGAVLLSGLFSAIGLALSALSGTPLIAAFLATVVNVALVFTPLLSRNAPGRAGEILADVVGHFDVMARYQGSFQTGALDSAHVLFYVAWTVASLFLTVRIVESRRWLG